MQRLTTMVQLHLAVNPIDALVIPRLALTTQEVAALPEATTRPAVNQCSHDLGISNRAVIRHPIPVLTATGRHSGSSPRSTDLLGQGKRLPHASPTASEPFSNEVPHGIVLTRQFRANTLVLLKLLRELFHWLQITCFNATVLRLPVVVRGI